MSWLGLVLVLVLAGGAQALAHLHRPFRSPDYGWPARAANNLSSQHDKQPAQEPRPCCACDEAKYELVFEALWSRYTHPDEFPENAGLAKFGDLIGASHSGEFRMWQQDAHASDGVKELAETGSTKKLEAELKQVSSMTRTIIKARELQQPSLNSKTSAVFRTDRLHHLVSILSKLSPSPDWMVGVSGLELCQADCSWAQQRTVDLYLWDAGTDSGQSFEAPDWPTRPADKIRAFRLGAAGRHLAGAASGGSSEQPAASGFQSASGEPKPFARLTITRQRIYEKSCQDEPAGLKPAVPLDLAWVEPSFGQQQQQQSSYADCRLSDWSEWSACSSRCGKGLRTRSRQFLDERAPQYGCSSADLVAKEVCISECQGSNVCVTRDWTDWSECSVSCGKGLRKRTRAPIEPTNTRACEDVELAELEPCTGSQGLNCSTEPTSCQVTDWSHWSECSVACGKGTRIRTRQYLSRDSMENCSVKLLQKQACLGRAELCKHSTKAHSLACSLPPQAGPCKAALASWYFDKTKATCVPFTYGGCLGNSNRFSNLHECLNTCSSREPPRELVKRSVARASPSSSPEECSQPPETGSGGPAATRRWYFDMEEGACLEFTWAGQVAGPNNFRLKADCEETCLPLDSGGSLVTPEIDESYELEPVEPTAGPDYVQLPTPQEHSDSSLVPNASGKTDLVAVPKLCQLPVEKGLCRAALLRWHYEASVGACKKFTYGGCGGNQNRFNTRDQCEQTCSGQTRFFKANMEQSGSTMKRKLNPPVRCYLPGDPGQCRALSMYWFHDRQSGSCKPLAYGGCGGNENKFLSRDECERVCMPAPKRARLFH